MKRSCRACLVLAALLGAPIADAHPGSGIAVEAKGEVYFVHTGVGVFKVDRGGRLVRQQGTGYHFMILDPEGRFVRQRWPGFPDGVIDVVGANPSVLLASSFPVALGRDGALYYAEAVRDGRVHMMRLMPLGKPSSFAILPLATEIEPDGKSVTARWIHGLAAGRDGTLYYAEQGAVRRIGLNGAVTSVVDPITVPDCTRPRAASDERVGPALRGLDVSGDGTIYVAASGCSAVLRITPTGAVSVVLRSVDSWSPTGVAVAGDDLYVLEYHYIEVERAQDWLPRVRKVSRDGTVSKIAVNPHPGPLPKTAICANIGVGDEHDSEGETYNAQPRSRDNRRLSEGPGVCGRISQRGIGGS